MDNSQNNIFSYVKQRSLKNYFNSQRDFLTLFPADNFDFSSTKYTHFLYLDTEEAKEFLLDFLYFIKSYYNCELFSYENYFSIFDEFKTYLENNDIFFYTKTRMGLNIANYSSELLLKTLKQLFGESHFAGDKERIAFSDVVLSEKTSYTYGFFDFLTQKVDGYNYYKYIVESLHEQELNNIEKFFKGCHQCKKTPFYLSHTKQNAKDNKKQLIEKLISGEPTKVFKISKDEDNSIALVILKVVNDICNMTILCDCDCYDSDINIPLTYICGYIFDNYEVNKITTVNENKGISFSGINSALVIAHFKPDYSLESEYNGYSKIKYDLKEEDFVAEDVFIDKSIIKFAN